MRRRQARRGYIEQRAATLRVQRDARRLLAKNKIKGMLLAAELAEVSRRTSNPHLPLRFTRRGAGSSANTCSLAEARRVKRVKDELERVGKLPKFLRSDEEADFLLRRGKVRRKLDPR